MLRGPDEEEDDQQYIWLSQYISLTLQCRLLKSIDTTISVHLEQENIRKITIQTAVFIFSFFLIFSLFIPAAFKVHFISYTYVYKQSKHSCILVEEFYFLPDSYGLCFHYCVQLCFDCLYT